MASKDAFYFKHDSNAQDDPKCMVLIDQMGMEGYGIFWAIIEKLRNESDYKLPLIVCSSFAKRWGTSREKVETVIKNYGLFKLSEDGFFWSDRLSHNMNSKSEKARLSASYRWGNANALQTNSNGNSDGMQNDAKRKEKKIKEKSKGVKFCEKGEGVFFKDGGFQKFGPSQSRRFKEGGYQPHYITKGEIE